MEIEIKENLIPTCALIVYNQEGSNYYVESRKIKTTKNGYEMMAGNPLSKNVISKIIKTFDKEDLKPITCKGMFPKNLLYFDNNIANMKIVWLMESSVRKLHFVKNLNIEDGDIHLPNLIFKLSGNGLHVYACKTSNVNNNTLLYKAPFHNVYDSGNVCMGTTVVGKSYELNQIITNMEAAFFQSKFSHLQTDGSPINTNLNTYLNNLVKTKEKFDNSLLIKTNKKLIDIL